MTTVTMRLAKRVCFAGVFILIHATTFAELLPIAVVDGNEQAVTLRRDATAVDDALARTGKAIRMDFKAGQGSQPFMVLVDGQEAGGLVEVRLSLRGEGLTGLAQQVRFRILFRNHADKSRFSSYADYDQYGVTSATRLGADAYAELPVTVRLPAEPATYEVIISAGDGGRELSGDVTLWLDGITILQELGPHVAFVDLDKTAYRPGESATAEITLRNPTGSPFTGQLVATDEYGLTHHESAGSATVSLAAGETATERVTWKIRGPESGRYLRVALRDAAGKTVHANGNYFAFARDPSFLATLPFYSEDAGSSAHHSVFFVAPSSSAQCMRACEFFTRDRRLPRIEFMAWDANNLGGLLPDEGQDPFLAYERRTFLSFKQTRRNFQLFHERGTVVAAYVNGNAWGRPAYELFKRHPEWFVYDRDGRFHKYAPYDMSMRENEYGTERYDFKGSGPPFFYGRLNATLPEVRNHIADTIIAAATVMGFRAVRWDVWSMEVTPTDYDLLGRPLAADWEAADRLSAESLAAVKERVGKIFPDFSWGYNYGAPAENSRTPLFLAEKCRNGGWILDEVVKTYNAKSSPYHIWSNYRDRIVGWGDQVRQLGGYYNPFGLNWTRVYAEDRLYETIFRLIGSGRPPSAYASRSAKPGDLGLLAYRYSNVYLDLNLRLQPKDQTLIDVAAPDTVWWREMVLANSDYDNHHQAIVHLVNSPVHPEVTENPASTVRPPVANIVVSCGKHAGTLPSRAWILMSEPMTPDGEPRVQAVPAALQRDAERVRLTVPSLQYLKTVVFSY
ncbi:MAG: hypothetical protein HQ523_07375 [Lentisphaerae bacterium]|nr:hypothetical protein [Lentisphaerota bacterium]